MKRLNLQEQQEIVRQYAAGDSSLIVAKRFHVWPKTVRMCLERHNVSRRSHFEANRKYKFNQDFFETIDNEEKAYWLGFLAADGGVCNRSLVLALAVKDRDHLQRFASALQANYPIRTYTYKHTSCRFVVTSKKTISDLEKWGVTKKKTYILPWPTLPRTLQHHYLRGYADGDGSWVVTKGKKSNVLFFSLMGQPQFLVDCQKYLIREAKMSCNKIYPHAYRRVSSLVYGGSLQALQLFSFLYKDATIYLPRKRNKVLQFIREREVRNGY